MENKQFFRRFLSLVLLLIIFTFTSLLSIKGTKQPVESSAGVEKIETPSRVIEEDTYITNEEEKIDENTPFNIIENEMQVKRQIDFGVVVSDYANKNGTVDSLEQLLQRKIDVLSFFKQFGNQHNNQIIESDMSYAIKNNKSLLIAWEPWDPEQGNSQSRDYLTEIANGSLDAYITEFLNKANNLGVPVIIRFGHEMNGNWYPWGQRSEEYVRAYRYIVDLARKNGLSNINWMWSINAESVPFEPISNVSKYFPGDNYVDVIGIDGFNFGNPWISFENIFSQSYYYVSQSYDKPIYISETAASEQGGNKANWINDMFNTINRNFIRFDKLIWFNILKEADWRIESSQSSTEAFRSRLQ